MGKPDDNSGYVAMAVEDNAASAVANLKVDPATSRLLIAVTIVTSTSPVANTAKTDDNFEGTAMAVTDDADATIKPLLVDNRNGLLWADISVE